MSWRLVSESVLFFLLLSVNSATKFIHLKIFCFISKFFHCSISIRKMRRHLPLCPLYTYRSVLQIRDVLSRIRIRPLLHPGSGSRIRGVKKHRIPDLTYFCIKAINKFCLLIPDPTIAPSRIPDPDTATDTVFQFFKDVLFSWTIFLIVLFYYITSMEK
jgi:hypothetical protein